MPPRVIVFGYGELGLAALDTFARIDVAPVAVVVPGNRDAPAALMADGAGARGYRVLTQPHRSALSPFLGEMRALRPDLLLVWSYSMILPQALIDIPRLGAVNVHGGLLPEYRGGHVLQWALINGEAETGVTLHYIDAGIDTGPLIAQTRFPIQAHDDAASLQRQIKTRGQDLLIKYWGAIADGTAPRVRQDESRARYFPMRTAEDGRIDWTRSSAHIANLVRALVAPWPGAFVDVGGTRVVFRRAVVRDAGTPREVPGTVTACGDGSVRVATGSGELAFLSAEIDGREADAAALVRAGLQAGARLG
jgi:methionyl-tRNA formyltransferase